MIICALLDWTAPERISSHIFDNIIVSYVEEVDEEATWIMVVAKNDVLSLNWRCYGPK